MPRLSLYRRPRMRRHGRCSGAFFLRPARKEAAVAFPFCRVMFSWLPPNTGAAVGRRVWGRRAATTRCIYRRACRRPATHPAASGLGYTVFPTGTAMLSLARLQDLPYLFGYWKPCVMIPARFINMMTGCSVALPRGAFHRSDRTVLFGSSRLRLQPLGCLIPCRHHFFAASVRS